MRSMDRPLRIRSVFIGSFGLTLDNHISGSFCPCYYHGKQNEKYQGTGHNKSHGSVTRDPWTETGRSRTTPQKRRISDQFGLWIPRYVYIKIKCIIYLNQTSWTNTSLTNNDFTGKIFWHIINANNNLNGYQLEQQEPTQVHFLQSRGPRAVDQMKPGMRSHDEIKLHHESIKTSLFISTGDLITIWSTKNHQKILKQENIFSRFKCTSQENWSARKFQNFRIYVDMQQRKMKEFKARFHVNNPNHNKLASGILGSLLLFICL